MLPHPLLEQLHELKLTGMLHALQEQFAMPASGQLSFDERLGLLIAREMTVRAERRLPYRLQKAKLRQAACIEDIDYRHPRGLEKTLMQHLISCRWLDEHLNCLITGPTVTPTSCTPRYVIKNLIPVVCHSPVTTPHARPVARLLTSGRLAE